MAQLRSKSTVGGKQIATEDQIEAHINNSDSHITESDRSKLDKNTQVLVHTHDPSGSDIWFKVIEIVEPEDPSEGDGKTEEPGDDSTVDEEGDDSDG